MSRLSGSSVEAARLAALASYDFSDPKLERDFRALLERAAARIGTYLAGYAPVGQERVRIFAPIGIEPTALPRERTITEHAIQQDEMLVIPNTLDDPRT